MPTTPAPVTTTTGQASTTAVASSTVRLNSTTPIDIDDWRLIMGDKFNTLQVLAITELVFAFIIFVFGHRVEIFWSLSTSPDRTVMARTGGVNGNFELSTFI